MHGGAQKAPARCAGVKLRFPGSALRVAQRRAGEAERQQRAERHRLLLFAVPEVDGEVRAAEFGHHLPADAAGRRKVGDGAVQAADDGDLQ